MDEKKKATSPEPLPGKRKAGQKEAHETKRRKYREASQKRAEDEKKSLSGNQPHTAQAPYFVDDFGYLCQIRKYRNAEGVVRLANFKARITEENIIDDGTERTAFYSIEGALRGTQDLPVIEVPASSFSGMNWLHKWGSRVILEPGRTIAESVRHSIQVASDGVPVKVHYAHTGWRKINGTWAYLHAAGAVGMDNVSVRLSPEYDRFQLPGTPESEAAAIRISKSFLDIGPRKITLPLLIYIYLAPLTTLLHRLPNFSAYIWGVSGSLKTTMLALMLCHFGSFTNVDALPNFNDTAGSVEKRAFKLKDCLFPLDDYAPSHRRQEREKKEDLAQASIRAFANRTGRARLKSDASELPRTWPRGMLIVTGEEVPSLPSTLARLIIIEMHKQTIDIEKLTELQTLAHRLPHAMTSYLLWIRDNMKTVTESFEERFLDLRAAANTEGHHGRFAETTAFLSFACETWVKRLQDKKIVTESEGMKLLDEGWEAFQSLADMQNRRVNADDPLLMFFEIMSTLVFQHRGRLDPCNREGEVLGAGDRLGFYDDEHLYLVISAAWNAVMQFLQREGGHFPFTKNTFLFMLKQRGSVVPARNGESTKVKTINGASYRIVEIVDGVLIKTVTSVILTEE